MDAGLSWDGVHRLSRLVMELTSAEVTLEDLLQSLADSARDLVGAHQAACALSVDGRPTALNATSLSEKYAAWADWDVPLQAGGITTWAREQNRSFRLTQSELEAHPRWTGFGAYAHEHPPMNGYLVAPFVDHAGRNVGLLQLSDRYEGEFTETDLEIAEFLASIGSAAIENRRLVEEVGQSRRRLEAVTDALPGGILVRDLDGRVTYANRWIADYLELDRDAVQGTGPGVPYALVDEHGMPLPADRYPSLRAGRGERFDSTIVGIPGPRGQLRWLATSGRPLVDDHGQQIGGLIVFVDSSEQVEAQRKLAAREIELREMQRIGGIGSWSRSIATGETTVSDELRRLVGLAPDEPVDRELLYEFVHPDDRRDLFEGTFRAFSEGTPFAAVMRGVDRTGREVTVEIHAVRFDGPDGQPAGLRGTVRDLTDLLEQEERMARAQRMETIGRLAGGLAHDFNNLLTVLSGHAELLRLSATDGQRGSIDAIAAATDRASRLTRQLLEYGRKDVLQPQSVDINQHLVQFYDMARSAVPSEIELQLELADDPPFALVDPQKLDQVLLNLILNSRDALVDHGRIVVRTGTTTSSDEPALPPGRYVSISVVDDGPGMTGDVLDRALEPFFTTKPQGAGSGLGLATSYGIIAQSGGLLALDSVPDAGTTARILLPVTAPDSSEPARDGLRRVTDPVHATILLAEDDDQLRPLLATTLERHGHRVFTAVDGDDAINVAAIASHPIDLLITDVSMPGRGGHDLATMLVAVQPDLRVLFMSGYTDDTVLRRAAEHGRIDFIAKPFRLEQLVAEVDEILRRPSSGPGAAP